MLLSQFEAVVNADGNLEMVRQQKQHELLHVAKHVRTSKPTFRDSRTYPLQGNFMLLDLILERL